MITCRPLSLAPDRICWGQDNRGVMLRVIADSYAETGAGVRDPASRIENRAGEPAANPYLYLASQIASGLDGVFPKGLPVGRVTKVSRKDRGLFLYAEVTPDADASRLEEVLVALPSGEELRRPAALANGVDTGPPDPAALGLYGPPAPALRSLRR